MNKRSVAIVGLGNIGQGYDYREDILSSKVILSHATAVTHHPGFKLIAGVDISGEQRRRFYKKFCVPSYETVTAMLAVEVPDILVVAVPSQQHYEVFTTVVKSGVRAIVCEKPLVNNISEAMALRKVVAESPLPIVVNFTRRFNPAINKLREIICEGSLGKVYKSVAWYTKGLRENGTHFVDLIIYLFGSPCDVRIIRNGRLWMNHDPEPDILLSFGDIDVYLLAGKEEAFSMGRLEVIGTRGSIYYGDGEFVEVITVQEGPVYDGHSTLSRAHEIKNDNSRDIYYLYDNLSIALSDAVPLNSSFESGLETLLLTHRICDMVEKDDG
ncbi:Gfo/Idh/MocA family oxidoreductase [Gammaproteobacteria bacterium]|nr:Gfo/Idh/MocA family oxidoreductase [Gammaproteobacteria bacterium]